MGKSKNRFGKWIALVHVNKRKDNGQIFWKEMMTKKQKRLHNIKKTPKKENLQ
jgi:hypothetical protein